MKQLSDFVKEYKIYDAARHYRECYLNSMMDFFGDDLPEGFKESLINLEYKDYILESLTSHDVELLKNKLCAEFKDIERIEFLTDKQQSIWIISKTDLTNDSKFNSMLEIFGYYITVNRTNGDLFSIAICPRYAKDAYDIVSKNHGKLYHFTAGKYVGEIEKKGLRCKKSSYRDFPERVYLYASDKHLDKIPDIGKFIKTVVNPFDIKRYGLTVYRIDMNKLKSNTYINFYTDDYMDEEAAVYTYNNIPAECITKIDVDLNKLL